jgi:hypothetical protein
VPDERVPADAPDRSHPSDDRPARTDEPPVLPDVTSDEQDVGWGDPYDRDDDERFLRDVPPHHGS